MNLVVCPLKIELDYLLSFFEEKGYIIEVNKVGKLTTFVIKKINLVIAQAGHGKVQFAIQTQFLIDSLKNIKFVFCTGLAGSLSEEIKIFDVVIATKTIEHDYNLKFIKKDLPEFSGDIAILNNFKSIEKIISLKDGQNKIHFGIIASGDEDIIDSKRALELKIKTGALAVAWEGAGGGKASEFNNISFIEIRGISDNANSSAKSNFKENSKIAMSNVAQCLESYFSSKELQ